MPHEVDTGNLEDLNQLLDAEGFDNEQEPERPQSNGQQSRPGSFDAVAFLTAHGQRIHSTKSDGGGTTYTLVECPFDPSHKAPDSAVFVMPNGAIGFKCLHNSCASFKWQDVRRKFDPGAYDRKSTASGKVSEADEPAISFQRITLPELLTGDYALEFLIDGVLVAGQPLLIGGGYKTLKTSLILEAGVSLSSLTKMLGRFTVNRRCRVAIMSGESGLGTLQETVRRILAAKYLNHEDVPGLIFSPDLPQTDNARHQVALRDFLRADDIELVIIDPAYLCLPCDDNGNLFKQGAVLRMLTEVCREAGAAVALCHHTRPIADNRPATLQDLAWAGFKEFARQWWLLNRRIDFDPKSPGEHRLWLTLGGSAGFNSLWGLDINEGQITDTGGRRWEVSTLNAADAIETVKRQASKGKAAKTQDQLNQDVAALMEAAAKFPEGETKNILKTAAGISGTRANLAIASALKSAKLVTCDVFKESRRTPYEGLKLKPKPDQSDQSD